MKGLIFQYNRQAKAWKLYFSMLIFIIGNYPILTYAHQSPTTNVLLDINAQNVGMELQLPIPEFELAFGNNIAQHPESIVEQYKPQLEAYLKAHILPYFDKNNPWKVEIVDMKMDKGVQVMSGPPFWELIAHLKLIPNANENTRNFKLQYDAIMHQVINHKAYISIKNDWENGIVEDNKLEIGVIEWDIQNNVIPPFSINMEEGSAWKGFKRMCQLGMSHIAEGTDHLLFLLVLLLPATLLLNEKKYWGNFGGIRYSLINLIKIVTAFTIGHSITLLIGAFGWVKIPSQWIEIAIAFSILVSAIHAFRPLFAGKEAWVAAGFGLIHGLAFSNTLIDLSLSPKYMALSILGFNIGIELMQLFIIALTIPWLILLSQSKVYPYFRNIGAFLVAIAAIAWMVERIGGQANIITKLIEQIAAQAPYLWVGLAVLSITSYFLFIENSVQRESK